MILKHKFFKSYFEQVKIIDFGCATEYKQDKKYQSFSGTPEFFPPEVFKEHFHTFILIAEFELNLLSVRGEQDKTYYGESMTVWSLGTLLYVLLFGDIPYDNTEQIMNNHPKKVSLKLTFQEF